MRIYLIRHGRQNSPLCNVNVPLSDAGRRQAELLGKRLKKESIDAVWSSDLIRARETADIINEKIRAPRIIREGLREISFGDLEGLSDDVIMERYADFFAARASMKQDKKTKTSEKRVRSFQSQNSTAQSHKIQYL